ncbi:hypothetical protein F4604DRAFT_1682197 [Suillus subluteus]|nr:hypothetical protein F4604DRAFT_1682197 [Suillus subluteus]
MLLPVSRGAKISTRKTTPAAAEGWLPAASFIRAFPNVEELVLGGADEVHISSALLSLVIPDTNTKRGTLAPCAWPRVKTILLDGLTPESWKRCVRPLRRWMRACGHEGEIVDMAPIGCKTAHVNAHVLKILQMGSRIGSAYELAAEKDGSVKTHSREQVHSPCATWRNSLVAEVTVPFILCINMCSWKVDMMQRHWQSIATRKQWHGIMYFSWENM